MPKRAGNAKVTITFGVPRDTSTWILYRVLGNSSPIEPAANLTRYRYSRPLCDDRQYKMRVAITRATLALGRNGNSRCQHLPPGSQLQYYISFNPTV